MKLQNGYKVIYDKAAMGEHVFYASKTSVFADADEICRLAAGQYKLVYEKNGQFYGSATGIPTDSDRCFTEFDKVFVETEEAANEAVVETEEPAANNDEPSNEPTYDLPESKEGEEE